jgi:hypothetical protein
VGVTSWRQTSRRIHVETSIRAPIESVWLHTQSPELHAKWDARFSTIDPIDGADDGRVRFRYSRRILPGLTIEGVGESIGHRHGADGSATSALTFRSSDWRSLIQSGSGYWKYIPTDDGVRFLTEFSYRPRWGRFGRLIDRIAFRPVFAWLTAWSFERLRTWLETGKVP